MTGKKHRASHSLVKIDKHWQWQGLDVVIRLISKWSARWNVVSAFPRGVVSCVHAWLCIDTVQGCRQDYRKIQGQGGLKVSLVMLPSQTLSFGRKKIFNFQRFFILCTNIILRSSFGILILFHTNNRIEVRQF